MIKTLLLSKLSLNEPAQAGAAEKFLRLLLKMVIHNLHPVVLSPPGYKPVKPMRPDACAHPAAERVSIHRRHQSAL
jgi:hypothetical protein